MMIVFRCYTLAFVMASFVSSAAQKAKPNFVLIMTDDQGYDDYGFRQPPLETPNMDRLMKDGVQFTRFYTAAACAPTRSQLLTGRNFMRTGTAAVGFGGDAPHLDEYLLGEALQDAGYVTGMVGKWNLGSSDAERPIRRGFDETWEVTEGERVGWGKYEHYKAPFARNGTYVGNELGWQDERVTDKAIDFIKRHKEDKFFLYLPYTQPHEPWHCRTRLQKKYMRMGIGETYSILLGMIDQLDFQVGRVLQELERNGLSDDTIVLFFGDNGPTPKTRLLTRDQGRWRMTGEVYTLNETEWATRNPTGLRSRKGNAWENGIRNRLSIYCPARFIAKEVHEMAVVYDIYPTLLSFAGVLSDRIANKSLPPLTGQSLRPLLVRDNADWPQHRAYLTAETGGIRAHLAEDGWYYRFTKKYTLPLHDRSSCLVVGKWVVVFHEGDWYLFDLSLDPKQENNLKDVLPVKFRSMRHRYFSEIKRVRQDPHAWSDPVQVIGLPGVEEPYLEMDYVYRMKGENGVTWSNTFFKEVGAIQEMKVRVLKSASYEITVRADDPPTGTKILLRAGRNIHTSVLNTGENYHKLGEFAFPKGVQKISTSIIETDDVIGLGKMPVWSLHLKKVE